MGEGDMKGLAISTIIGVALAFIIVFSIRAFVISDYTTYRLTYMQGGKEVTRIIEGYPQDRLGGGIIVRKNNLMPVTFECIDCKIKQIEEIKHD